MHAWVFVVQSLLEGVGMKQFRQCPHCSETVGIEIVVKVDPATNVERTYRMSDGEVITEAQIDMWRAAAGHWVAHQKARGATDAKAGNKPAGVGWGTHDSRPRGVVNTEEDAQRLFDDAQARERLQAQEASGTNYGTHISRTEAWAENEADAEADAAVEAAHEGRAISGGWDKPEGWGYDAGKVEAAHERKHEEVKAQAARYRDEADSKRAEADKPWTPDIPEPKGLGAVAELANGSFIIRHSLGDVAPWIAAEPRNASSPYRYWENQRVARVLSLGVVPVESKPWGEEQRSQWVSNEDAAWFKDEVEP